MSGDPSLYSFEIVKLHPLDAEDITVTVEYDAPLTKRGRREMEFRIDAWCSAVQTCMFADPSELKLGQGPPSRLKQWGLVGRRDEDFRPECIACRLGDQCLRERDFEGLFKMLHCYNLVSGAPVQTSTRLNERRIIRVTIE